MSTSPPFMKRMEFGFPPAPNALSFSNTTRPVATYFAAGSWIWNTDDNAPNWSDGTVWRDAEGNVT